MGSAPNMNEGDILHLKAELELSRRETEELNAHLNCLTTLIKSAMHGDGDALSHLSEITGVKPSISFLPVHGSTSLQVKAVKNWALLTAGLLHRDYKTRTKLLREKSSRELAQRSYYLDKVQDAHRSQMKHTFLSPQKTRPNSGLIKPHRVNSAPLSGRRENSPEQATAGITAGEFFTCESESTANLQDQAMAALQRTNHAGLKSNKKNDVHGEPLDYADPGRYEQKGLYDATPFVSRSRPVSAKSLQMGDSTRSRPKSNTRTVHGREESGRPLKYETTRPISSKKGSNSTTRARQPDQPHNQTPYQTEISSSSPQENNQTPNTWAGRDGVMQFSDELRKMDDMERQFKMTTFNLQKKIGIRPDGII